MVKEKNIFAGFFILFVSSQMLRAQLSLFISELCDPQSN
jgi:hypothetical protein